MGYMTDEYDYDLDVRIQAEEAAKAQNLRTAREMLGSGSFTDEEVSRFSFLTLEEVRELKHSMV